MLAGHSAGGVIATIYAARYPAAGVVNVDQPLQVEPFARLVRSLAGPLRGPGFAQVWEQFEASMGIGQLPLAAQDLLGSARYVRQDLVTGYWREGIDRPVEELAGQVEGQDPPGRVQLGEVSEGGKPHRSVKCQAVEQDQRRPTVGCAGEVAGQDRLCFLHTLRA